MSNELDFSKPEELQVRDGSEFRIYATDHCGLCTVAGAVKGPAGWHYQMWGTDGKIPLSNTSHPLDLIRKHSRVTGWVNWYKDGRFPYPLYIYEDRESAKAGSIDGCQGQIYIDAEIQT